MKQKLEDERQIKKNGDQIYSEESCSMVCRGNKMIKVWASPVPGKTQRQLLQNKVVCKSGRWDGKGHISNQILIMCCTLCNTPLWWLQPLEVWFSLDQHERIWFARKHSDSQTQEVNQSQNKNCVGVKVMLCWCYGDSPCMYIWQCLRLVECHCTAGPQWPAKDCLHI